MWAAGTSDGGVCLGIAMLIVSVRTSKSKTASAFLLSKAKVTSPILLEEVFGIQRVALVVRQSEIFFHWNTKFCVSRGGGICARRFSRGGKGR